MNEKKAEHLIKGNHKDSLRKDRKDYKALVVDNVLVNNILVMDNKDIDRNRLQNILNRNGGLLEKYDTETSTFQPLGHIASPFFRVFPEIDYPDRSDFKITRKLKFGLSPKPYKYSESTVGLELEFVFYDKDTNLINSPPLVDHEFIHPTTEFFHQMGELGTNPSLGGVYIDVEEGLEIHKKINKYLVGVAAKTEAYACLLGSFPSGHFSGNDISVENEYLRRISRWLSLRMNKEKKGITSEILRNIVDMRMNDIDIEKESQLHEITALYNVMSFQPMIAIPNHDGDLCIQAVNFLNGPIKLALMGVLASSPFWRGQYTGYKCFRGELRHIFKTGLRSPSINKWFDGTRERTIKHLKSGEGINLGRAIISDQEVCYSNSLFRIRPSIGSIEVAGLDSHPIPELRVAVAEICKLIIHYVNSKLIEKEKSKLFNLDISGVLNKSDYYKSYASITRYGKDGKIYKDGKIISTEKVLGDTFDMLRDYIKKKQIMSISKFQRFVEVPIMSQFRVSGIDSTSYDIFKTAAKTGQTVNISDHLVSRYGSGKSIKEVISNYLCDFYKFY